MASGRTLDDWLRYQEQLHPVAIELGLERVTGVWQSLKSHCGEITSPVIVVGGTNGKGSTVAYIEQIYHQCGYTTVAYTSPHILRYNERIRLDTIEVDDPSLIDAFERVEAARGELSLSYFEFGTLAALYIAAIRQPDILILEVGLGGRLDAVNILDHDIAIVTNVALDHMEWLGDTLSSIAVEKAGIARPARPLITASNEMPASYYTEAERHGATVFRAGHEFEINRNENDWDYRFDMTGYRHLPLPGITGVHQINNAACAITAVMCLQERIPVSETCLRQGLAGTRLAGRFEQASTNPLIILDVAHNPAAAEKLHMLVEGLEHVGRTVAVMAMQSNREILSFVQPLVDDFDAWHVAPLSSTPGHTAADIKAAITSIRAELPVVCHDTVGAAVNFTRQELEQDDCMVIFGSFYTVSEAQAALHV